MRRCVFTNQEIANVLLTPTSGGTLVNGAVLAQQATYTAGRNTNARVRLAAAVASGAHVTANAGTVTIGSNVASPSVGGYVIVPAGAALNVTRERQPVGAPATAIAAAAIRRCLYTAPRRQPAPASSATRTDCRPA